MSTLVKTVLWIIGVIFVTTIIGLTGIFFLGRSLYQQISPSFFLDEFQKVTQFISSKSSLSSQKDNTIPVEERGVATSSGATNNPSVYSQKIILHPSRQCTRVRTSVPLYSSHGVENTWDKRVTTYSDVTCRIVYGYDSSVDLDNESDWQKFSAIPTNEIPGPLPDSPTGDKRYVELVSEFSYAPLSWDAKHVPDPKHLPWDETKFIEIK